MNDKNRNSLTPMHFITAKCSKEIILMALKEGVKKIGIDDKNNSIVKNVVDRNDLSKDDMAEILSELLKTDYDCNYGNDDGIKDIDIIMAKLRYDKSVVELKKNMKILPYIVFHLATIEKCLSTRSYKTVCKFLDIMETDVNCCVANCDIEGYLEVYIRCNLSNDDLFILKTQNILGSIEASNRFSKAEKLDVLDKFDKVFLAKLNIYEVWFKIITKINSDFKDGQKNRINVLKEKLSKD
jgi:hypothetical protein